MPLTVRFLGTSAARPTVERSVTAIAVVRDGETFLFDCGEGTQRQMMRYGISLSLNDILFSHFHVDHFLGVVGLLRTFALQGRAEPLRCYGPRGAKSFLKKCETLGADRLTFPLEVQEFCAGEAISRPGYELRAIEADHRGADCLSWALVEHQRLGRFDPDIARSLGVPEGPLWGRIHRGEAVTLDDGTVVEPSRLVGPTRPGRRVVITGDTRPSPRTVDAAVDADLLVHEATFTQDDVERAKETGHSTALEAAMVARAAGAKRLVLTHISARYSRDVSELERESRSVFPATTIARDGMEIDVPFQAEKVAGVAPA